jgi:hypothetical protein
MELSEILEVTDDLTQPRWVECPEVPGFAVLMRLPDVPGLRGLALQAVTESRLKMAETAGPEADSAAGYDPGAVGLRLSDYVVQDWRGLTGAGLRYFAVGTRNLVIKAPDDVVIPFSRPALEVLLKWSPRFFEFINNSWQRLESRSLAAQEDDEKNSLGAPAITPTPPPDTVAGAPKKRKDSARSRRVTGVGGPSGGPATS